MTCSLRRMTTSALSRNFLFIHVVLLLAFLAGAACSYYAGRWSGEGASRVGSRQSTGSGNERPSQAAAEKR